MHDKYFTSLDRLSMQKNVENVSIVTTFIVYFIQGQDQRFNHRYRLY